LDASEYAAVIYNTLLRSHSTSTTT